MKNAEGSLEKIALLWSYRSLCKFCYFSYCWDVPGNDWQDVPEYIIVILLAQAYIVKKKKKKDFIFESSLKFSAKLNGKYSSHVSPSPFHSPPLLSTSYSRVGHCYN